MTCNDENQYRKTTATTATKTALKTATDHGPYSIFRVCASFCACSCSLNWLSAAQQPGRKEEKIDNCSTVCTVIIVEENRSTRELRESLCCCADINIGSYTYTPNRLAWPESDTYAAPTTLTGAKHTNRMRCLRFKRNKLFFFLRRSKNCNRNACVLAVRVPLRVCVRAWFFSFSVGRK